MSLPPEAAAAPGSAHIGSFIIVERLGAGAFGEVWRAYDTEVGRWVALKLLKSDDPEDVARFLREARAAAALSHPGILPVYRADSVGGNHFIAMQLVRGGTARDLAGDPKRVAAAIRDAATALHAAHDHGIIHRDLKPANLLVEGGPSSAPAGGASDAWRVFVTDFGLAKIADARSSLSKSGIAIGTPAFMPPEQACGDVRAIDRRSDVYSLGATLYDLLAGHPPFSGAAHDVLVQVVNNEPPPLRRVDTALATIVATAMAKDPSERYPTALELADDLDRWLRGEPVMAAAQSVTFRLRRVFRRRKGVLAAVAVSLIALVSVVFFLQRATGHAAEAKRDLVEQMRRTSATCLTAALDLRHAGNLRGMDVQAERLDIVCRGVMAEMPALAEPYVHRAQMLRTQLRWHDALTALNEALKREPANRTARYERGLILAHQYIFRLDTLRAAWRSAQARSVAGERGRAATVEPAAGELSDRHSNSLRDRAIADLDGVDDPLARVLCDWLRDPPANTAAVIRVCRTLRDRDEAWEWHARMLLQAGDFLECVRVLTEAHERDKGYLPYLEARASARCQAALLKPGGSREMIAAALLDADELVAGDPDNVVYRWLRASIHLTYFAEGWKDPAMHAEAGLADLAHLLARTPDDVHALVAVARFHVYLAHSHRIHGRNDAGEFEAATAALDRAARVTPSADIASMRGLLLSDLAWDRMESGVDPRPLLREAIAAYDEAVKLEPAPRGFNGRSYGRLRLALAEQLYGGDPTAHLTEAIADAREAIRLSETHARAHLHLAEGLWRLAAHESQTGDSDARFEEADRAFTTAAHLEPTGTIWVSHAEAINDWARVRRLRGEDPEPLCTRARQLAEKARDDDTGWYRPHDTLARILLRLSEAHIQRGRNPDDLLKAMLAECDASIAIDPQREAPYSLRGGAHATMAPFLRDRADEIYRAAVADLTQALAINPIITETLIRRGQARVNWGILLRSRGENPIELYRLALEDYDKALAVNEHDEEALNCRAAVRTNWAVAVGGTSKAAELLHLAMADLDRAIAEHPRWDEPFVRRGLARISGAVGTQDPREAIAAAIADYDAALKLNRRRAETWLDLGNARGFKMMWLLANDAESREIAALFEKLQADFAESIRLDPSTGEALWRRGFYRMQGGAWSAAREDFEAALKVNPGQERRVRPWIEECRKHE